MTTTSDTPRRQPPEESLRTFTPPPPVHRLNPRAVIVTLGGVGLLLAFSLIFALVDRARLAREQFEKSAIDGLVGSGWKESGGCLRTVA